MDGDSIRLCIVFIIFVILSAFFSCTESAYAAVNKIRIKSRADEGDKKSKKALSIINNFDSALTTILIGNNIVNIAAASVATLLFAKLFSDFDPDNAAVISTVVTTAIIFLFGEMIPKSLANDRSETVSRVFAGSLKLLMKIFKPLVAFFSLIIKLFEKIFTPVESPSITEDELYDIIDTAEEEGVMDEEQSDMLKSALEFSGTTASDVMTVRDDIKAVDISLSNSEILDIVNSTNHSRLPVYEDSINNIVGYLQIRLFLREYLKNPGFNVRKILISPFFVSPNAKIDDLLTVMREHKFYLAVVSDDTLGDTLGIVTIEDFLEELVGEIWDEDDIVDDNFIKLGGNKFSVSTKLKVGEVFDRMNCRPPDKRIINRPVLSWVLETLGRMPSEDDSFIYRNLEVSVGEMENDKITRVLIKLNSESDEILIPAE